MQSKIGEIKKKIEEIAWRLWIPLHEFFPGVIAISVADYKSASLKLRMTFIYAKQVPVLVL